MKHSVVGAAAGFSAVLGSAPVWAAGDSLILQDQLRLASEVASNITTARVCGVLAGVTVLAIWLAAVYVVPLVRFPRLQWVLAVILPLLFVLPCAYALSGGISTRLSELREDSLQAIIEDPVLKPQGGGLAESMLDWKKHDKTGLLWMNLAQPSLEVTTLFSAVVLLATWGLTHRRVLRNG